MTLAPDMALAGLAPAPSSSPGKLTDLCGWMGLRAPVETGKDLRRGLDPWRLDPIPSA